MILTNLLWYPLMVQNTVKKAVIDESLVALDDGDDEKRLATVLKDIANDVLPDIQMEEDYPNKHENKKMAILDMNVWTEEHDGCIMFEDYLKPISSKKVMHEESALASSCKRSVHTQEVLR